jgi:hypothetical protein
MLAAMADQLARQAEKRRGTIVLIGEACRDRDAIGCDRRALREAQAKVSSLLLERGDRARLDLDARLLEAPLRIAQELVERQRIREGEAAPLRVSLERERIIGIGDVACRERRAQRHAFRHALSPKGHRVPENARLHAGALKIRRDGQPIRTGADDRDLAMGFAALIHGDPLENAPAPVSGHKGLAIVRQAGTAQRPFENG